MKITSEEKLTEAYKRLEKIEAELRLEYFENGETDYSAQLEAEYEQIENSICEYLEQGFKQM